MALAREEVNRKLLHVLSGSLVPALILYLPRIDGSSAFLSSYLLGILLVLSVLVEFARFRDPQAHSIVSRLAGSMMRSEEKQSLTGATYLLGSSFLCTLLFHHRPDISFIALNLFILGDAIAAIVGQSMGRIRIGRKSLEGSMACFLLCLLLAVVVYPRIPLLLQRWNGSMPWMCVLLASLSTTLLELFPIRLWRGAAINDNLVVPIGTGLILLAVG